MRVPLIAGNWKMNTNIVEAVKLLNEIKQLIPSVSGVEILVCPPFVTLSAAKDVIRDSSVKIGAQNMHFEENGAFTGEISAQMLTGLCEYVILGHSERRQYFHESNEVVNKKVKAALKAKLKPVLCVGENLLEYEGGSTVEAVTGQLKASLLDVYVTDDLVIAYEPVWAIGTGKAATGERANYVATVIRKTLAELSNEGASQRVRILYGGSVTAENIKEFISQPEIDGGLVGGASLKADQFVSIIKQTAKIKTQ